MPLAIISLTASAFAWLLVTSTTFSDFTAITLPGYGRACRARPRLCI